MAPINDQSSYSFQSSSSSSAKSPFSCLCRGATSDDGWGEWFLPISRRGHFFQDSIFENSRSHFDSAIRDILGKWDDSSIFTDDWNDSTVNNLNRYRQLRSRNRKEENQAVTVSSDSTSHKIVLDVHDFIDGEVKVKVIGEKEVLVEGILEEKKFSRRFPLPLNADVDAISSVMSSDGILTINVPMKNYSTTSQQRINKGENNHTSSSSVSQSSSTETNLKQKSCEASSGEERTQKAENKERYCENCYKNLQSQTKSSEDKEQQNRVKIPIKIDTSLINGKTSSAEESQNFVQSKILTENMKTDASENYKNKICNQEKQQNHSSNQSHTTIQERMEKASLDANNTNTSSLEKEDGFQHIPISVNFRPLPITRRGRFFNDSIFENARNDFQSAIQDVLSRWGERSSILDDLSSYRSLRTRDLREENQAVKVNEDETNHKFVLDVHDFMNGGEVNVKAVNDRELVVEGQVEKQEGGSKSVKRFFKRFTVPDDIILESVSSVMSSDGVLTITAPKKPPSIQIQDVTSPIRTEKEQEMSQIKIETMKERQHAAKTIKNIATVNQKSCESESSSVQQNLSSEQKSSGKEYIIPVCTKEREHVNSIQTSKTATDSKQTEEDSKNSAAKSLKINKDSRTSDSSNINIRQEVEKTKSSTKNAEENSHFIKVNQVSHNTDSLISPSSGRNLPISKRGSFFHDSFFKGSRQNFTTAVKDVLRKFNENSSADDITAYRNLRLRNLSKENQAVSVQDNEHSHKVILDARDFTGEDISVSVVDGRELLIEGRTEHKKDSSSSSQSFSRRFLLPDSVDINSITSAISSDGVLTVESVKNGNSGLNNAQKMSSEAHSKNENHNDSGHSWQEKAVKESSEQSEGYSSRSHSTSYRAHHEQTFTNEL